MSPSGSTNSFLMLPRLELKSTSRPSKLHVKSSQAEFSKSTRIDFEHFRVDSSRLRSTQVDMKNDKLCSCFGECIQDKLQVYLCQLQRLCYNIHVINHFFYATSIGFRLRVITEAPFNVKSPNLKAHVTKAKLAEISL